MDTTKGGNFYCIDFDSEIYHAKKDFIRLKYVRLIDDLKIAVVRFESFLFYQFDFISFFFFVFS